MKNKEKNVLQPHILTKYHEIDVWIEMDQSGKSNVSSKVRTFDIK